MATLFTLTPNPNCDERIEVFNRQNKKLLTIYKQHMEIHERGSGDYLSIIKELIEYMSTTFHEENMVMMHAHYPAFLKHAREHQKFTQKVEEFLESYEQGDRDLGFKIFIFLKDWMRDHTSKLDVECADYLHKSSMDIKKAKEDKTTAENASLAYAAGT